MVGSFLSNSLALLLFGAMESRQQQPITFSLIRGGRFSAILTPRAAEQLSEAVARLDRTGVPPRMELEALQVRLASGQAMSQGDMLSLLHYRPNFQNLGADASSVLDQVESFVRQRMESNGKRPGVLKSPFSPILVLPPRPVTADEEGKGDS